MAVAPVSVYANEISFGSGTLIATPTGQGGLTTPIKFGILQDVALDFTADLKELYGQNRYAVALAPGKTKIELKAKFAAISGVLFNTLFFGSPQTATQTMYQDSELVTVPATGAATVSSAHASVFGADQGVYYDLSGQQLASVSVPAAAGQYSEANGIYTFDTLDAGALMYLNYTYQTTSGVQIPLPNPLMGIGPTFGVILAQTFDGRQATYVFPNCQASKLSMPTKQDDFTITEVDFMVAANRTGVVGYLNTSL
jgi:hypothetical protein